MKLSLPDAPAAIALAKDFSAVAFNGCMTVLGGALTPMAIVNYTEQNLLMQKIATGLGTAFVLGATYRFARATRENARDLMRNPVFTANEPTHS